MTPVNQAIWVVSGLLLFVVAFVKFNRPPTNRTGTTFFLFYTGMFFYYALLVGLWLFVIVLLSSGGYGLAEIKNAQLRVSETLTPALPIIGLLFIAVASQFKRVRKIDAAARQICIQLAAIPAEAEQLGMELAGAEFRVENEELKGTVSGDLAKNIDHRAINFTNDGTPAARFTRAISLYWLFVMPYSSGTPLSFAANTKTRSIYTRIMRLNENTVDRCASLYGSLMENGLAYFTSQKPTREMDEGLKRNNQELSQLVCSLIARFVLCNDVRESQRRRRLSSMGFNTSYHVPAFGRDQWIGSILTLAVLMLFMSIVLPGQQSFGQKFMYSILMAVQLGMAVIAGTIVADRFIQKKEGAPEQFPPLLELTAASLLVIGLSIMLRIGWPLIPGFLNTGAFDIYESVQQFMQRWPFVLLPFVCTLSIGVLCSYFGTLGWGWLRLAAIGGLINGLAFAATAVVIVDLLDEGFLASTINISKPMIIGSCAILGLLLGVIVLPTFSISPQSRRINLRPSLPSPILISDDPLSDFSTEKAQSVPRGAIRDVGGYSRDNATEIEGQYVCFRPGFSNPAVINAYHMRIRWDDRLGSLVFQEEDRVDRIHTQSGQVFIPDGKPFISLVTIDKGAVRVITVNRPDEHGIARGLIFTLSNPKGVNFIPACAPVVLQKLGDEERKIGLLKPDTPDYKRYIEQLNTVAPDFGLVALPETGPMVVREPSALVERPTAH
jgi:hypothetical protein